MRGLLVIAPTIITGSFLFWLFEKVDHVLSPLVTSPGLGILTVLLFVVLVGWISTFLCIKRISRRVAHGIEHTPVIGFVYTCIRDFFEAFVGNRRRFTHAVLVNIMGDDVWFIGFITDESPAIFNLDAKYVSVYIPKAYTMSGQLCIVPRERTRPIEHINAADVMKYAITGGTVVILEKNPEPAKLIDIDSAKTQV
jgi:uncharacterized membrane protein